MIHFKKIIVEPLYGDKAYHSNTEKTIVKIPEEIRKLWNYERGQYFKDKEEVESWN